MSNQFSDSVSPAQPTAKIALKLASRLIVILTIVGAGLSFGAASSFAAGEEPERLRVSDNGRYLVAGRGEPVFIMCDTAWSLSMRLRRDEVNEYLAERKGQRFNAIAFVFFNPGTPTNAYGSQPFNRAGGKFNPAEPITTPGGNPVKRTEYDYCAAPGSAPRRQ